MAQLVGGHDGSGVKGSGSKDSAREIDGGAREPSGARHLLTVEDSPFIAEFTGLEELPDCGPEALQV